MNERTTYIELGPVRVGSDSVAEMDAGRPLVLIHRDEVIGIEARVGTASERPLVSVVLGLILLGLALAGPVMIVLAIIRDVEVKVDIKFATTIAFAVPAVWLLDLAARRRAYLQVRTKAGVRKLLFERKQDPVAAEQFVAEARSRFGYP